MEDLDRNIPIHVVSRRNEVILNLPDSENAGTGDSSTATTSSSTSKSSSSSLPLGKHLSKEQVLALVDAKVYTVGAITPHSSPRTSPGAGTGVGGQSRKRSVVWRHFSRINDSHGNHIDFVLCNNCRTVLSYNGTTTSHMRKHLFCTCTESEKSLRSSSDPDDAGNEIENERQCECEPGPTAPKKLRQVNRALMQLAPGNNRSVLSPIQERADEIENKSESSETELMTIFHRQVSSVKKRVTERIVQLCAKDGRPFDIGASRAFEELAQLFVDIGAQYGSVPVKTIIPSDRTISNNVKTLYGKVFEMVKREIDEPLKAGGLKNFTNEMNLLSYSHSHINSLGLRNIK